MAFASVVRPKYPIDSVVFTGQENKVFLNKTSKNLVYASQNHTKYNLSHFKCQVAGYLQILPFPFNPHTSANRTK